MTEAETRLWEMLRSRNMAGHKFRRQVPIGRYIADFVCHEARLILEVDGGQHSHSLPREAERTGFLQSEGYCILRFWNHEVLAQPDGVHRAIVDELGRITPTQTLPHRGGGFSGPKSQPHDPDNHPRRLLRAPGRGVDGGDDEFVEDQS